MMRNGLSSTLNLFLMNNLSSLALFVGFLHLAMALPTLFSPSEFRERLTKLLGEPVNLQLLAFPFFLLGYFMVASYPWIQKTPETILSVFGYLILLRSVIWLWFPSFVSVKVKRALESKNGMTIVGLMMAVFGLLFFYLGSYVY